LTLGLYTLASYWKLNSETRKVNSETRDFARARHDRKLADSSPLSSALAVTLGALPIVPAVVSIFGTVHRTQRVERRAAREPERSAIGPLGHHGDPGARSSKRQTLTRLRKSP
jgi:hypothetical protein